jgi:hypothetical protein
MRDVPILGAAKPGSTTGPERFKAACEGEDCDQTWEAHGTIECRRAMSRAQKHADRTGHRIAAEWANRR